MPTSMNVGPILGIESNTGYTLVFSTPALATIPEVTVDGATYTCQQIGQSNTCYVWRAEFNCPLQADGRFVTYQITSGPDTLQSESKRQQWMFYVPGADEQPRIAYGSCNGFSSSGLMHKTERPYQLWEDMAADHKRGQVQLHGQPQDQTPPSAAPFGLLLMGGDQVYADEIWESVAEIRKWNHLNHKDKIKRQFNQTMARQVDRFYDNLYQERWNSEHMSLMLAQIPSVMMWDDHDIFDGWGSFPDELQNCPVFQGIYETACRYFEWYQVRSSNNAALLSPNSTHYSQGFTLRDFHILALDNRAERSLDQVMGDSHWHVVNDHLDAMAANRHLLVLSAVPVVYRDFSFAESVFDKTPWEEELTDDLKDHWRAKEHQGERARLIHRLLRNANQRTDNENTHKTIILSGDVHIGSLGVIEDNERLCKIHQVVSSGIVHPAPSRLQWLGIIASTNDDDEYLDESRHIRISMLQPFSSDKYIRKRNYVTLYQGTDNKIWINWTCEGGDKPYYPID